MNARAATRWVPRSSDKYILTPWVLLEPASHRFGGTLELAIPMQAPPA